MIRLCLNCKTALTFFKMDFNRIPKKYCNETCRNEYRKKTGYHKKIYEAKHPEIFTRECVVCKRNIKAHGKRKKVNKDSKMYAQAEAYKEKQKLKRALNKQKDFLDGKVKN